MKGDKTLFLSMEVEIMKMSILIDEILLTRLDSAAITEPTFSETGAAAAASIIETASLDTTVAAITDTVLSFTQATVSSHCGTSSVMEAEIEKFKRVLLRIKDLLDAETSVEKWVIDYLRLGQLKGFIFKDEQVPRVETSAFPNWWTKLRLVLDDVRDVFDEISIDVSTITRLRERLHDVINLKPRDPRRIDYRSNMDGFNNVFGLQEDVKRIIKLLLSNIDIIDQCGITTSSVHDAHVIPIIGDSGIGKTAVAKLVYNDDKVDSHFDWKMWINLSNQSLGILGVAVTDQGISDKHFIFSKILKSLHGKKFLLVLDGVSNEICCDWAALQVLLMAGANGSRILITIRSFTSSTLGTVPPYRLEPLSYEECLELFIYRASRVDNAAIPSLQWYRDMLKWFQGFPSLVVALGDFSHSKPNEWEIQRVVSVVEHNNALEHISSTMLGEYHGLPSMHIKQCLLYCALFPKGYTFQKRKLIWLWMAEGFIQPKRGLTIEEVGLQYFEKLFFTSFLQLNYEFGDHMTSFYFVPDSVHNFVEFMSGNEYFRIDNKETCLSGDVRHLSVCRREACDHFFNGLHRLKHLQTLLFIGEFEWHTHRLVNPIKMLPPTFFLHLTSLRILDMGYTGILALPGSISEFSHLIGSKDFNDTWLLEKHGFISDLKHLRFLDLSGNDLICLPEKMSMCHNLETLIIIDSPVERLPREMGKLISLRHLVLGDGNQRFVMPPGIGNLTNLQTLRAFIIGSKNDDFGRIEDLRELVNLRGSLLILGLDNVPHEKATQGGWLADKAYLQQLDLVWDQWHMPGKPETAENLLAGLQPHTNLVHLKIAFYGGLKFPFWLGDPTFSNLETIELLAFRSCDSLPPLGHLPFLQSLKIQKMDALEYIDDKFLGKRAKANRFPSLRTLILAELSCLKKWSGLGKGDMHLLEQIEVSNCKMLTSFPTFQFLGSLKSLRIMTCPKVESLPEKKLPSSLESLVTMSCPLLEEKFEKLGEEWWERKKTKLQILKGGI